MIRFVYLGCPWLAYMIVVGDSMFDRKQSSISELLEDSGKQSMLCVGSTTYAQIIGRLLSWPTMGAGDIDF